MQSPPGQRMPRPNSVFTTANPAMQRASAWASGAPLGTAPPPPLPMQPRPPPRAPALSNMGDARAVPFTPSFRPASMGLQDAPVSMPPESLSSAFGRSGVGMGQGMAQLPAMGATSASAQYNNAMHGTGGEHTHAMVRAFWSSL
jgi:hypothetical protein